MNDNGNGVSHEEARAFVLLLLTRAGLTTTLNREDVRLLTQAAETLLRQYVRLMPQTK